MPIRDEVLNWFEESKADLRHSEVSLNVGDYNWACFAARQAVKKALKSLILHMIGEYPLSHDLVKLYNMVKSYVDLKVGMASLSRLSYTTHKQDILM